VAAGTDLNANIFNMTPDFFDTHTHLNFSAFDNDRDEVVARTLSSGVWVNNVGTQTDTSELAVEMTERYQEGVFATVGLHPVHTFESFHDEDELGQGGRSFTSRGESFDLDFYRRLAQSEKVVAIGETGLDYYHLDEDSHQAQRQAFEAQIALANELQKPLMLHIRNGQKHQSAYTDTLDILESQARVGGNAHFFAGSQSDLRRFLDLDFCVSFTGVITLTSDYDDLVRFVPLDRLLSETDAPYVAPKTHRSRRNEPLYVREVVDRIISIRPEPAEKVKSALVANARRLFAV